MKITVTIVEGHDATMQHIVDQLRSNGMEVERVLEAVGIITGSAPDDRRAELEALDGVASVDEDVRFRMPPPTEDVQ